MNVRATVLGMLLASATASAAPIVRLESDGKTVGQLVEQLRSSASHRLSSRSRQAVSLDLGLSAFIFQGAGSLAGQNGTFFHSDVMLVNFRGAQQTIAIGFLRQGQDNSNELLQYFTIPASTPVALDDFVAATLHTSGFGAVLVVGVDATQQHNLDPAAILDGQSRIWTFQPGSAGKVSLGLPAIDVLDIVSNFTGYALGLRQDASARTNVGIVNLDSVAHTWSVTAHGQTKTATFSVTVPALSVTQVAIPAGSYGDLFLALVPATDTVDWSAYGVSVDSVTGDSWESHVVVPQPLG